MLHRLFLVHGVSVWAKVVVGALTDVNPFVRSGRVGPEEPL